MKMIPATAFIEAFGSEWDASTNETDGFAPPEYEHSETWTKYMLASNGFLNRVLNRLKYIQPSLRYAQEWYKLDALFLGGTDLFGTDLWYPSEVHVYIEHEQGDNPEHEMWKLIHWRAPLKVLIFYDWNEYEKTTDLRTSWLDNKLKMFSQMISTVASFFEENQETEYLFLIGNRKIEHGEVTWRWASNNRLQPTAFRGV